MPRLTARISFPGEFAEPKQLTNEEWLALEEALGKSIPEKARKKIALIVTAMAMRLPKEKKALTVSRARKKIQSFEKKARNLRDSIWYGNGELRLLAASSQQIIENHKPDRLTELSRQTVEERFFQVKDPFLGDQDGPILKLLAHALDAVIATCNLADRKLVQPDQHVVDGFFITSFAVMLRRILKSCGLPYKARKDVDKMSDEKSRSPFIKFFDELQTILQLQSVSNDALATRIHRLENQLKNRVHRESKKRS